MRPGKAPGRIDPSQLHELAVARRGEYLDQLRTLVNIDCGTYVADGVNRVADFMQAKFEDSGWTVDRLRHDPVEDDPQLGDALVATLGGSIGSGSPHVLLIGHMDTVFPAGTAAVRPFKREGDRAFGPGVSDMKGGLLAGLHAVGCLRDAQLDPIPPITYVCNPDEEIGSPFSGDMIRERAKAADVCFVLEGARENGDIVSARKGVRDIRILYTGRAAHAGVEPERGRSATLQAALTTAALHELNGLAPGVTVNVGVLQGGTRPNVVAERCEVHVDVRATTSIDFERAIAEVERIARETTVPDVQVVVDPRSGFPPMEKTDSSERLVARAKAIASEIGFEVSDAATGGASDANPVAGMGVPTLDGLGPIGGADHSPAEWLDLTSIAPRIALLAALIASPFGA